MEETLGWSAPERFKDSETMGLSHSSSEILFPGVVAAVVVAIAAPFVGNLGLSTLSSLAALLAATASAYLLLLLTLNAVNIRDWIRERRSRRVGRDGEEER
ncbi:MAG: hypothetical protein V3R94_09315 [Acidobacteriota bacterium]